MNGGITISDIDVRLLINDRKRTLLTGWFSKFSPNFCVEANRVCQNSVHRNSKIPSRGVVLMAPKSEFGAAKV